MMTSRSIIHTETDDTPEHKLFQHLLTLTLFNFSGFEAVELFQLLQL